VEKVKDIQGMVRANIRALRPYSSARDEFSGQGRVFLDANENPLNPPLNRYPDPRQSKLKSKLGALKGQSPENIFLGNGSDEAIDLLFRVFCEPGRDNVITVDPTYGMYRVCADINNVACKSVFLKEDFSLDARRVLDALDEHTRLVFLCSPNNPTSNTLEKTALEVVVDGADCPVVVDEAYGDFNPGGSLLSLVPEKRNLVVLQTLSKAWGLAGIRLGMAFAHPELIAYMSKVKYPYNLNALTIEAAMEALEKQEEKAKMVSMILEEREKLAGALAEMPFVEKIHPSDANFLLIRVADPRGLYGFLMEKGIIVRDRSSVPLCSGCLRITVGSPAENLQILEALKLFKAP
jgi:histidinol-phosphate aminotransferase